jgi:hypothetical protein
VRVGKLVHPCRFKSFRTVVSTVTNDLVMDCMIINNFNLIVELGIKGANKDPFLGYYGGDPS